MPPDSTPRGRVPVGVRPFSVSTFSLSSLRSKAQAHRSKPGSNASVCDQLLDLEPASTGREINLPQAGWKHCHRFPQGLIFRFI